MKVEALWVYPIKSCRGIALPTAELTQEGIPYDRRFMLARDMGEDKPEKERYHNMHVSEFPEMCLFACSIAEQELTVAFNTPQGDGSRSLKVPLVPDVERLQLDSVNIEMHTSPTAAVKMPQEMCSWFSECFGFSVVFLYLDEGNRRPVLGNISPNAVERNPIRRQKLEQAKGPTSWLSSVASSLFQGSAAGDENGHDEEDYRITFADCAPFLVVSSASIASVSPRLMDSPEGEADITKFRPNIIVSGAGEAWAEDYWGEITIKSSHDASSSAAKIQLTANCLRCTSLNVDYKTGKATGEMLKKLQSDRRVDGAIKYSPVFGRYGFLGREGDCAGSFKVAVGDEVAVSKTNEERTAFRWPGMGPTKREDLYPV